MRMNEWLRQSGFAYRIYSLRFISIIATIREASEQSTRTIFSTKADIISKNNKNDIDIKLQIRALIVTNRNPINSKKFVFCF